MREALAAVVKALDECRSQAVYGLSGDELVSCVDDIQVVAQQVAAVQLALIRQVDTLQVAATMARRPASDHARAGSPATPASSPPSWAAPANPSTWAGKAAWSPGRCAEHLCCGIGAARSPAATAHPAGAKVITSDTGATAARPNYPIWCSCAATTTGSSTIRTGKSESTRETGYRNSSRPHT